MFWTVSLPEMVDPIDLVLLQRPQDLRIERLGGVKVVAKRLLDHHAAPLAVSLRQEVRCAQPGDCDPEQSIRDGKVEEVVAGCACRPVEPGQMLAELAVGLLIIEVALQIAHPIGEPTPRGLVEVILLELAIMTDRSLQHLGEALAPFVHAFGGPADADEPKSVGQLLRIDEIIERRHDQALRQVAGGAEDDHGAGRRCHGCLGLRHALWLDELILDV